MARKLCATELFSARRVDAFERARAEETRVLVRGLFESAGAAVQLKERLLSLSMRNILRMVAGDKWSRCYGSEEGAAFLRTVGEAFAVTSAVRNVGVWVPWLGWLDLQGFARRMKKVHELFPYLDAVVKKTMRLHPVSPIVFPHLAREDTVVAGYDVPAGTRVLVNAWTVARDLASWPDAPGEFRPERFLAGGAAEGVDVRGAHFQLLPFGSGRRMCPAYNLALKEVAATLANLVHGFAWRLPEGVAPEDVSMEEFFGLSISLKVPLVAVAEPRLPAHLYAAVVPSNNFPGLGPPDNA